MSGSGMEVEDLVKEFQKKMLSNGKIDVDRQSVKEAKENAVITSKCSDARSKGDQMKTDSAAGVFIPWEALEDLNIRRDESDEPLDQIRIIATDLERKKNELDRTMRRLNKTEYARKGLAEKVGKLEKALEKSEEALEKSEEALEKSKSECRKSRDEALQWKKKHNQLEDDFKLLKEETKILEHEQDNTKSSTDELENLRNERDTYKIKLEILIEDHLELQSKQNRRHEVVEVVEDPTSSNQPSDVAVQIPTSSLQLQPRMPHPNPAMFPYPYPLPFPYGAGPNFYAPPNAASHSYPPPFPNNQYSTVIFAHHVGPGPAQIPMPLSQAGFHSLPPQVQNGAQTYLSMSQSSGPTISHHNAP